MSCLAWCTVGLSYAAALMPIASVGMSAGEPKVGVTLTSPRPEYVIGEPILLKVVVKNISPEPITAEWAEKRVRVLVSEDGKQFQGYPTILDPFIIHAMGRPDTLPPNASRTMDVQLVYSPKSISGLVIEKPGTFWVKATFNLIPLGRSRDSHVVESEVMQIRVKEPTGVDAQVWQMIKGPEFAAFLQRGRASSEIVAKSVGALQQFPTSAYHSAIRDALHKHYEESKYNNAKREEVKQIRAVLGIKELLFPEDIFPEDKRLDTKVEVDFPQQTPIEKVLESLTKRSGVPLDVAPEFKRITISSAKRTIDLRNYMYILSAGLPASWVQRGDGYFLSKEKNSEGK